MTVCYADKRGIMGRRKVAVHAHVIIYGGELVCVYWKQKLILCGVNSTWQWMWTALQTEFSGVHVSIWRWRLMTKPQVELCLIMLEWLQLCKFVMNLILIDWWVFTFLVPQHKTNVNQQLVEIIKNVSIQLGIQHNADVTPIATTKKTKSAVSSTIFFSRHVTMGNTTIWNQATIFLKYTSNSS